MDLRDARGEVLGVGVGEAEGPAAALALVGREERADVVQRLAVARAEVVAGPARVDLRVRDRQRVKWENAPLIVSACRSDSSSSALNVLLLYLLKRS